MSYNIILIDDDKEYLFSTKLLLQKKYDVMLANSLAEGLQEIKKSAIDLVLLDIDLSGDENGLEGLRQVKQLSPDTDVIMVTGSKEPKTIVQAVRAGATDYLCKPFAPEELLATVEKTQSVKIVKDKNNSLIEDLNPVDTRSRILGSSPVFRALLEKATRLRGHTEANILILGESGTGKELLARYIHSLEKNTRRPFIAVNCAAIPEGLIESELFGHERGAFTGASYRKIGKFELAAGGDIFLDEISSLRQDLQAKILRVLQEREIVRVGGNATIAVNFRVISATNDNLMELINNNKFRVDLYHRLRVVELDIPPLRERHEDIVLLVAYFLDKLGKTKGTKKISAEALRKLQEYTWPGNVRELENAIHSMTILAPGEIITEQHLPNWMKEPLITAGADEGAKTGNEGVLTLPDDISAVQYREFIRGAEKIYIQKTLQQHGGDKTKTAEALNMGRTTLYGKLKELGLFN